MPDEEESDTEELEDHDKKHKQSRVGKMLSDLTTIRIVVLVLSMLIALPLFTTEFFGERMPTSASYGADDIFRTWKNSLKPNEALLGGPLGR